jgi:glycerophosphoryl diester phosphodiesterase
MAPSIDRPGSRALRTLADAMRGFRGVFVAFAATDLLYKAIAFAALAPLIGVLFRLLIARGGSAAVADVDIALFFFTTRPGLAALILISALLIAVVALEQACLMTLGLGQERGVRLRVRDAALHGAANAFAILRLTVILVVRLLLLAFPFAVLAGAAYWALLRYHDINYYLTDRPPSFWIAAGLVGIDAFLLAIVLGRMVAAWVLTLPLVVFEDVLPVLAFGESRRRMEGRRMVAALALAAWGLAALLLPYLATKGLQPLGRLIAPAFSGSMAGMLLFIGGAGVVWLLVNLAIGVVTSAWFALIVVRLYLDAGVPGEVRLPQRVGSELTIRGKRLAVSWVGLVVGLILAVLVAGGAASVLMRTTWASRPVLVFAHRGASAEAPENTLASFERAGKEHTDFVELDVQESSDGVVVVAHDSDLMKVGHSPLKIWASTAEELRSVDIGSYFSPAFADQRVPTLAEALELCKGVSRMNIELKDYGRDQRLEERVVEGVEAAGMQDQIVTMSLSRGMVEKLKSLRPGWTSGLLVAKSFGSLSHLPVDFLAVESGMATRSFIRSAHKDGKPVYVWTVDDSNRMIRIIGLGADGLITNRPALAKQVVARYARMNHAERLFLFVMTRLGASEEISEPESDLRP